MITINLLKKTSSRHKGARDTRLVRIILTGILGLAIVAVSAGIMRWWIERPRSEPDVTPAAVAATEKGKKPASAAVPATMGAPEKNVPSPVAAVPKPEPSEKTAASSAAVPQPVPSIAAVPEASVRKTVPPGPAPVPDKREAVRKISNEVVFVKQVFNQLAEIVPDGIGFGTLSIDSFSTVTGVGTVATRELVSTLFLNLRRGQLNLLGHPYSYIGSNDGNGYTFVFVCKPDFSKDTAGAAGGGRQFVPKRKLRGVLKAFSRIAARNALFMKRGLSRTAVKKRDGYIHHGYRLSCSGTYRNFVSFILELDEARVPCAFAAVRLTARSAALVEIRAEIDFITRE